MCAITPCSEMRLPADESAPGRAREFLTEAHCEEHTARVVGSAVLLVSELVTNAVQHGAPPILVAVDCDGTAGLRVRVRDGDPAPPTRWVASPYARNGAQLYLVDLLSDAWGIETQPDGKEVWFRLREH